MVRAGRSQEHTHGQADEVGVGVPGQDPAKGQAGSCAGDDGQELAQLHMPVCLAKDDRGLHKSCKGKDRHICVQVCRTDDTDKKGHGEEAAAEGDNRTDHMGQNHNC
jgi:hypothetical protein